MSPPRYMSPPHPRAVRSLFPTVRDWIESPTGLGVTLRPWQALALERILEVDADGNLCWLIVVVTTPRQSGKGWLIQILACVRMHLAMTQGWGLDQEITHVARDLGAARRIMMIPDRVRWAESNGISVRTGMGTEKWIFPNGEWRLSSLSGVYGSSAGLFVLDETWDITREALYEAVLPTVVERVSPQVVLLSTAHREATPLTLSLRRDAIAGSERVCILEWSAPDGSDPSLVETWRAASAHWSPQREEIMRISHGNPGFEHQWLNRWPQMSEKAREPWPPRWGQCGASRDLPAQVVVVESSTSGSAYGVVWAAKDGDGRIHLRCRRFWSLESVREAVQQTPGAVVLAGMSIAAQIPAAEPYGQKQTAQATSPFAEAVSAGRVFHDHSADMAEEVNNAAVSPTESGLVLSAKRSGGPVPMLKAAIWAVHHLDHAAAPRSRIW